MGAVVCHVTELGIYVVIMVKQKKIESGASSVYIVKNKKQVSTREALLSVQGRPVAGHKTNERQYHFMQRGLFNMYGNRLKGVAVLISTTQATQGR